MRGATVRLAGRQDSAQSTAKQRKSTHFRILPFKFYPHQVIAMFVFTFQLFLPVVRAGRSRPVGLEPLHKPKLDPHDKDFLNPLGSLTVLNFGTFELQFCWSLFGVHVHLNHSTRRT